MALRRALSLFSGIGGIDLACEWAGIETAAFCEKDPYCRRVLAKHWPDVPIFEDIHYLNGKEIEALGPIDIVTGGFPCQPVSVAGRRRGQSDERWLWPQMLRIIDLARPAWVVAENVPGLRTLGADRVVADLERAGYASWPLVVGAFHAGAPHRRQRVFIVAYERGKQFEESRKRKGHVAYANDARPRLGSAETTGWSESKFLTSWWTAEPAIHRVAHGIPARVDRLRALGNAVVPQQIYPIFAAIQGIPLTSLAEAA